MIPVRLEFEGLYSYKTRQIIDFKPLTKAGLFGIFGAVGSGKSSILDAITLALYNEVGRMSVRDNRNYNLMHLEGKQFFIEFEFLAGPKHKDRYLARVTAHRNSKRHEDINRFERILAKREDDQWVPVDGNAEAIIGLSYDHFVRSVIIPQGQFESFLRLSPTDRTRMARTLFQLDRFELDNRVGSLLNQVQLQKSTLDGQRQSVQAATPDAITILTASLMAAEAQLRTDTLQRDALQAELTANKAVVDLQLNVTAREAELARHRLLAPQIVIITQIVTIFDQIKLHVAPLLTIEIQSHTRLRETTQIDTQLKVKLETLTNNKDRCVRQVSAAKAFLNKREIVLQEIQDYASHVDIQKRRTAIATASKEVARQQTLVSTLQAKIQQSTTQKETLHTSIANGRISFWVGQMAVALRDGVACPVCGSLEHPAMRFPPTPCATEPPPSGPLEALQRVDLEIQKCQEQLKVPLAEVAKLQGQMDLWRREVQDKDRALQMVRFPEGATPAMADLEAAKVKRENALREAERIIAQFDPQLNAIDEALNQTIGQKESHAKLHLKTTQDMDTATAQLSAALISLGLTQTDAAGRMAQEGAIAGQRAQIIAARETELKLTATIETLSAQLANRQVDPVAFQSLASRTTQASEALSILTKSIGEYQAQKTHLTAQLALKIDIENRLTLLNTRECHLNTLRSLFRKSGFVSYAARVYLTQLIETANTRFQPLSRMQLRLELGEDNDILVRDLLSGGQLRSAKTLSGGQVFQASLCLALALADIIHAVQGHDQSFFFLDEGFGTQDTDSLDMVFKTLLSLRNDNRTVGIISHVDALKVDIPVHLQVTRDPISGSRIEVSG